MLLTKLTALYRAYRRPVGILHVKVVRAMGLKKKDLLGASDPYVKLKLSEDKLPSKKSTVKHKNLNPEWNEEFNLVVKDPQTQALEISVYDWEQVHDSELHINSYKSVPTLSNLFLLVFIRLANTTRWV